MFHLLSLNITKQNKHARASALGCLTVLGEQVRQPARFITSLVTSPSRHPFTAAPSQLLTDEFRVPPNPPGFT